MKISGTHGLGGIEPVAVERQSAQPVAGNPGKTIEDPLTLSSTARAREAAAAHPRFGAFSVLAHRDPELAKQLAYDYAHTVHGPLYDLRGLEDGTGPLRYSATGESVTPESELRYEKQGESLQAASLSLYNGERAKGTDAADIFDKLIELVDSQSEDFRTIIDWEGKTASWPVR